MAEYITSVLEIREAGLPVNAAGEHTVRIIGAVRERPQPVASGSKEAIALADFTVFERYFSGELVPPPPEAGAPEEPMEVPQAVFTTTGELVFLKRGGSA